MRLPQLFDQANRRPFAVRWGRPAREVAAALETAVSERRYIDPGREALPFYRLDGAVSGSTVAIRATPYVAPGVRSGSGSLPLAVGGELRDVETGSELVGWIAAPIPAIGWWIWAIVSIIWFVLVVPTSGIVPWLALEVVLIALALAIVPRNQRRTIERRAGDLTRILAAVGEGRPAV